jgi:hypothetical protein
MAIRNPIEWATDQLKLARLVVASGGEDNQMVYDASKQFMGRNIHAWSTVVTAFAKAADWAVEHPDEARKLVAERLKKRGRIRRVRFIGRDMACRGTRVVHQCPALKGRAHEGCRPHDPPPLRRHRRLDPNSSNQRLHRGPQRPLPGGQTQSPRLYPLRDDAHRAIPYCRQARLHQHQPSRRLPTPNSIEPNFSRERQLNPSKLTIQRWPQSFAECQLPTFGGPPLTSAVEPSQSLSLGDGSRPESTFALDLL